jgi:hypothetical protein
MNPVADNFFTSLAARLNTSLLQDIFAQIFTIRLLLQNILILSLILIGSINGIIIINLWLIG